MIFKYLYRSQIKEWKRRIELLQKRNSGLKDRNDDLERITRLQSNRYKRLQYLINIRLDYSERLLIERTDKGVDVLTSLCFERNEIIIYDVDCDHDAERHALVLWFRLGDEVIKIEDIQGESSLGHGSVAIKHLVDFALSKNIKRIIGFISPTDHDHIDRLYAFYEKNQFSIDKPNGKVERKLSNI